MYCNNCGNFLNDGATFCPTCGAKVEARPDPQPTPVVSAAPTPAQPEITLDDQNRSLLNRTFVFSIIGLACGCTWWLSLVGLIFSIVARVGTSSLVNAYGGELTGRAKVARILSLVGLIVSIVMLVTFIIWVIAMIIIATTQLNELASNVNNILSDF